MPGAEAIMRNPIVWQTAWMLAAVGVAVLSVRWGSTGLGVLAAFIFLGGFSIRAGTDDADR